MPEKNTVIAEIKATYEERLSKLGRPYNAIVITLTTGVEKLVFLSDLEKSVFEQHHGIK